MLTKTLGSVVSCHISPRQVVLHPNRLKQFGYSPKLSRESKIISNRTRKTAIVTKKRRSRKERRKQKKKKIKAQNLLKKRKQKTIKKKTQSNHGNSDSSDDDDFVCLVCIEPFEHSKDSEGFWSLDPVHNVQTMGTWCLYQRWPFLWMPQLPKE